MAIEWIGLLGGLALLIVLTMRGVDLLIAAPVCALLVALSFDLPLFPQTAEAGAASFTSGYMGGFTGFVASWFFVFLLGSVFGKVMEDSGAADSVAQWVVQRFGARHALVAIVGACALLTYGGVSLFVVAFSVFPLALALFRQAGLPRRFIPATIGFGSVTFTMTSAGSPEIQNWIPMEHLGTTPYAAWQVSLVVAIGMATFGFVWLKWMVRRAVAAGEAYDVRDGDPQAKTGGLPHPASGLLPLGAVLGVAFVLHDTLKQSALIVALLSGVLVVLVVNRKYFVNLSQAVTAGTIGALIAIANTSAVVGFGAIAKLSPAFAAAVDALTSLPGNPLVGAAVGAGALLAQKMMQDPIEQLFSYEYAVRGSWTEPVVERMARRPVARAGDEARLGEVVRPTVGEGLAHQVHAFVAPLLLGGREATPAVGGLGFSSPQEGVRLDLEEVRRLGEDLEIIAGVRGV